MDQVEYFAPDGKKLTRKEMAAIRREEKKLMSLKIIAKEPTKKKNALSRNQLMGSSEKRIIVPKTYKNLVSFTRGAFSVVAKKPKMQKTLFP